MSYDFFSHKTVIGRKPHVCEQCRSPIATGESHVYSAGKFDGDFTAYREHHDCRAAWIALHELRGTQWYDTHPFIADDDEIDAGEREWLQEKHPIVAKRLGWSALSNPTAYATEQGVLNGQWNAAELACQAEIARQAPHVLMRPRVFPDGKMWCALYGDNLQDGVAGFGITPAQACKAFDDEWHNRVIILNGHPRHASEDPAA